MRRKRRTRFVRRHRTDADPPSTLETGTSYGTDPLPGQTPEIPYAGIAEPKD